MKEFRARVLSTSFEGFDEYELDEIVMSRLVVEPLLTTTAFYEKTIFIRFGQRDDYEVLPGLCLLMMALETYNSSVSHDVDGAAAEFLALSLESYPGENITEFCTEALRLIKIMHSAYNIPLHTGSRLLVKVSKRSSEEFNRKIFALMDTVKTME